MTKIPRLAYSLTFAGLIPFIVSAIGVKHLDNFIPWEDIFILYSIVIISFLCGIQWGLATKNYDTDSRNSNLLFITSNFLALLGFSIFFIDDFFIQTILISVLFTIIWFIDAFIIPKKIIPEWFRKLRNLVSPILLVVLIFEVML